MQVEWRFAVLLTKVAGTPAGVDSDNDVLERASYNLVFGVPRGLS